MRRRLATLVVLLFAGCGGLVGDNIVKYERGSLPLPPTEAPADATYALVYANDVSPQTQYPLHKGDRLGFIQRDAQVIAVAGEREIPIKTTTLVRSVYWRRMKPIE
jgi:hypothetical protein